MRLEVKVIANAKKEAIKQEAGVFKVYLSAPAIEGKANKALVAILARHFNVSKGEIKIIKGLKSRHKTIMINKT